MRCSECNSEHISKTGFKVTRAGRKQRFQCQNCGKTFYAHKEA